MNGGVPMILALPEIALERILSFLSFDEIAKNRLVCAKFNQIGGKLLTRGFLQVEKRHAAIHKRMKSMLPRRESERRSHPLARHCDILSAVETRLSMLTMTYVKYMDTNVCCFIPGKVIDEVDRILSLVEGASPPPRTHELLQELRDISSMAMEHFDEVILPRLKQKVERSILNPAAPSTSKSPKFLIVQQVIADELHKIRKQTKMNKQQITSFLEVVRKFGAKTKQQARLLRDKSARIKEQERKLQEQAATIADLKKHVEEWDQKFSDLTAELIRAREDLVSKSVSPASVAANTPQPLVAMPPQFLKSNIKARTSLSKFYEIPRSAEVERKRRSESIMEMPAPFKMPRRSSSPGGLQDTIYNKINETIACNVSQNISDALGKNTNKEPDLGEKERPKKWPPVVVGRKGGGIGIGPFFTNSLEMILKSPITSIKSRKRKMSDESI